MSPEVAPDVAAEVASDAAREVASDVAPETAPDVAPPPAWSEVCAEVDAPWDSLPLPEASGAVALSATELLVVADSGNLGAALVLDLAAETSSDLVVPLDAGASDDLEGLSATPDGRIVALTSSGYLRAYTWDGSALVQVEDARPLDPSLDWSCEDPQAVNCGKNHEGICLHPAPEPGACVGFAASKTEGVLLCLAEGLVADPTRLITVAPAEQLSGCAFEPEPPYRLAVAGNLFSASTVWEVQGYGDAAAASIVELPFIGAPNQEALLVVPGLGLLSFGDLQQVPTSPVALFDCDGE